MKKDKNWQLALPDEKEIFKSMSDILYTYLYSISKHNPTKINGEYLENWNYIYMDKGPNGEKKYSATETQEILKLSSATYYRKFNKLKELGLIQVKKVNGRKVIIIPYIQSSRILDVKTCEFLGKYGHIIDTAPNDIIKILSLLKIYYYSNDKTFTIRNLKSNLGYALNHTDKDSHIHLMLIILKGLRLVDYYGEDIRKGAVTHKVFHITYVDDTYNKEMADHKFDYMSVDLNTQLTDEEQRKMIPLQEK